MSEQEAKLRYEKLTLGGWMVSDNRAGDAFICDSEAAAVCAVVILNAMEDGAVKWKALAEQLHHALRVAGHEPVRWNGDKKLPAQHGMFCATCRVIADYDRDIELLEDIPEHLRVRSQQWLQSNAKLWTEVRHGAFPLGMVQSWIERAEESEARIEDAEAWGKRIEGERDLFLQRLEEKTARIEVLEQENERLKAQRKDQEPAGE